MLLFNKTKNKFNRIGLTVFVYVSLASVVWMLLGFAGLDQLGDGTFWLSMLCLLFIVAWASLGVFVIGSLISWMKYLICKIWTKSKNKKDKGYEAIRQDDKTLEIIAEFKGFDDWISSVSAIKYILSVMQYPVDCAVKQGYALNEVSVWGGVQETETGYEIFPCREYESFVKTVEKLPAEFATEQKKQLKKNSGKVLNFEGFTVTFVKDGALFELMFKAGKLYATEGLDLTFN